MSDQVSRETSKMSHKSFTLKLAYSFLRSKFSPVFWQQEPHSNHPCTIHDHRHVQYCLLHDHRHIQYCLLHESLSRWTWNADKRESRRNDHSFSPISLVGWRETMISVCARTGRLLNRPGGCAILVVKHSILADVEVNPPLARHARTVHMTACQRRGLYG